jgi:hypothetical protein
LQATLQKGIMVEAQGHEVFIERDLFDLSRSAFLGRLFFGRRFFSCFLVLTQENRIESLLVKGKVELYSLVSWFNTGKVNRELLLVKGKVELFLCIF